MAEVTLGVHRLAIAGTLVALVGCSTEEEPLELWGEILVSTDGDWTGGGAAAWMAVGPAPMGFRAPGTCATGPGAYLDASVGPISMRVGEFEREFGRDGYGGYLGFEIPEGTLDTGTPIRAAALGTGEVPEFVVTAAFPSRMTDASIDGTPPGWPLPELAHSLSEPITVTWTPGGTDDWVGFWLQGLVDNLSVTVGCSATDKDGSVAISAEVLQVFEPGARAAARLNRCARTPADADGVREVLLTACHNPGSAWITFE
jgi:hypothetical protein